MKNTYIIILLFIVIGQISRVYGQSYPIHGLESCKVNYGSVIPYTTGTDIVEGNIDDETVARYPFNYEYELNSSENCPCIPFDEINFYNYIKYTFLPYNNEPLKYYGTDGNVYQHEIDIKNLFVKCHCHSIGNQYRYLGRKHPGIDLALLHHNDQILSKEVTLEELADISDYDGDYIQLYNRSMYMSTGLIPLSYHELNNIENYSETFNNNIVEVSYDYAEESTWEEIVNEGNLSIGDIGSKVSIDAPELEDICEIRIRFEITKNQLYVNWGPDGYEYHDGILQPCYLYGNKFFYYLKYFFVSEEYDENGVASNHDDFLIKVYEVGGDEEEYAISDFLVSNPPAEFESANSENIFSGGNYSEYFKNENLDQLKYLGISAYNLEYIYPYNGAIEIPQHHLIPFEAGKVYDMVIRIGDGGGNGEKDSGLMIFTGVSCEDVKDYLVETPCNFEDKIHINIETHDPNGCANDGSIIVTIDDSEVLLPKSCKDARLEVSWYDCSDCGLERYDLEAGTYILILSYDDCCEIVREITLNSTAPSLSAVISIGQPLCAEATGEVVLEPNLNNVTITYQQVGGTLGGTVSESTSNPGKYVVNLPVGNYTFTLTSADACPDDPPLVITNIVVTPEEGNLAIQSTIFHPLCFNNSDGSIEIGVSGGTPEYSYEWAGPGGFESNNNNLYNLGYSGEIIPENGYCENSESIPLPPLKETYTVTITDKNGCTLTESFDLIFPPPLYGTIEYETSPTNCPVNENNPCSPDVKAGQITITGGNVCGGTPVTGVQNVDYYIGLGSEWKDIGIYDSSNIISIYLPMIFENLPVGTYNMHYKDKNGCEYEIPECIEILNTNDNMNYFLDCMDCESNCE